MEKNAKSKFQKDVKKFRTMQPDQTKNIKIILRISDNTL